MAQIVSGRSIAVLHTSLSAGKLAFIYVDGRPTIELILRQSTGAFAVALALGLAAHYERIVKNQWFGYPQEWWPSVSATIGDWYPERQVFQILVALTSGPRFLVVLALYVLSRNRSPRLAGFVALAGVLRTLACGGWVYITSSDSADVHDFFMIGYLVLNIPWMMGQTTLSPKRAQGAQATRSFYSIFEWMLIALDVAFDSVAIIDMSGLAVRIESLTEVDTKLSKSSGRLVGARVWTPFVGSRVYWLRWTAECLFGLVFWTNMTALGPMIFYSSVWNMGLSGDEVLLFTCLSPVLLSVPLVRKVAIRGSSILQALMLMGMAAYRIDDLGHQRLRLNAAAVGFGCIHYAAHWWSMRGDPSRLQDHVALNPLWPIMNDHKQGRLATGGYNTAGFAIVTLAWFVVATTPAQHRLCSVAAFPHFVQAITQHQPGPAFLVAFLVYAALLLASVWTVAYAFVPYGNLLRERTDLVLIATMSLIGFGFVSARRNSVTRSVRLLPVRVQAALTMLLLASVAAVYRRRPLAPPQPYNAQNRVVTAGIWTMHFAMDGRMWESQRRMADIIRDAQLDVIGLLESDVHRIVGGNREMTQYIGSSLGMYADIGPGPNQHTWGCALLSKFPILNSTHHLLPSPNGELAPAIHATLDVYGTLVDVVVAHNGQEEDPLDRYVVTKPHAERPAPYKLLVEDGQVYDVDPADDDRWCEYILFRGLRRVAYARLNRGSLPSITDTELQVAKFFVPSQLDAEQEQASSNDRIDEQEADPAHRFPSMFYGQGVRGHYFHVLRDRHGQFAPWYYRS
ncbi:Protein cwh43 [Microbotryomycetes sp. JL221]|nr:Protein cwh43 [Microbotryomycetes sp. JL221]